MAPPNQASFPGPAGGSSGRRQIPLINSPQRPNNVFSQEFTMVEQGSHTHDPSDAVRVIVWYDYI